ncbi:hypothetical protein AURDEDRAFT_177705 [Auricularia subglabra TFB-10046 SS5]|uniref:Uncharacterized protein n=1 Tax=Auricularia subglabra (strain TFB-10046 / SS5) TaxID=717982 RepID=J0WLL5_AURST|nr:hypothetical protein AURDEDRAFT_177705 [Auricularia subglabra TFB-10046 SS5]
MSAADFLSEGAFLRHLLRLSNADARSQPDEGVEARCAEASSHRGQPEAVDEVCGASDLKLKHNDELPIYYLDGSCVGRTGADLTRELTGGRWVRVDCEFVVWSMNDDSGSTRTFQLAVERMVVLSRLPGSAPPSGKSRIEGEGLTYAPMTKDGYKPLDSYTGAGVDDEKEPSDDSTKTVSSDKSKKEKRERGGSGDDREAKKKKKKKKE